MISYGGSNYNISILVRQCDKIAAMNALQKRCLYKYMLPSQDFSGYKTPFYAYDLELLRQTLDAITACVPANACVLCIKGQCQPVILSLR